MTSPTTTTACGRTLRLGAGFVGSLLGEVLTRPSIAFLPLKACAAILRARQKPRWLPYCLNQRRFENRGQIATLFGRAPPYFG